MLPQISDHADARPTPLPRKGKAKTVLVLGAGMAGLCAAAELTAAGHAVTVLEARARPGGRVWTLREPFVPGLYAEAGATYFPALHGFTLHYARRFQLPLRPLCTTPAGTHYALRGQRIPCGLDNSTVWPVELTVREQRQGLAGMAQRYFGPLLGLLGQHSREVPCPRALRPLDAVSLAELLRRQGASPAAIELLGRGFLDLVGDGLDTVSALYCLRDLLADRCSPVHYGIVGGNDQLPAGFARLLGRRLVYGHRALALTQNSRGVAAVSAAQADRRIFTADYLVCTLPCGVLGELDVSPTFSPAKAWAIRQLASTSVTRVYLQSRTRFWNTGAGMARAFTDLDLMSCRDASFHCPGRQGILEAFVAGPPARVAAAMEEKTRLRWALDGMEQVFPGIRDAFEGGTSVCWDQEPYSRGAYAWFRPGQIASLMPALLQPEGRIHFAGEHISAWPGWVQGALHSGYRAAREINDLP